MKDEKTYLQSNEYFELKARVHEKLIDMIDLALLDTMERNALTKELRKVIETNPF